MFPLAGAAMDGAKSGEGAHKRCGRRGGGAPCQGGLIGGLGEGGGSRRSTVRGSLALRRPGEGMRCRSDGLGK